MRFIGDSFTEGLGVDWDSTLVGRVASALAADSIEVLNAGVVGYSPVVMERKLRHYLEAVKLQVDEVAVVIDVSDALNEVAYAAPAVGHVDHDAGRPAWRAAPRRPGNHPAVSGAAPHGGPAAAAGGGQPWTGARPVGACGPMKPNRWAATRRIWVSAAASVMR